MHVCTVLMFLSSRNYNTYLLLIQSSPRQMQSIMFIIVFFVLKINAFGNKYVGHHTNYHTVWIKNNYSDCGCLFGTQLLGYHMAKITAAASLGPIFLVTYCMAKNKYCDCRCLCGTQLHHLLFNLGTLQNASIFSSSVCITLQLC